MPIAKSEAIAEIREILECVLDLDLTEHSEQSCAYWAGVASAYRFSLDILTRGDN